MLSPGLRVGMQTAKTNYVIMCNGYRINDIKLSFIIAACLFSYQTTPCVDVSFTSASSCLRFVCNFPHLPRPLSINSWTTWLGAHLSLSFARSRPGGTLTPPQAYIYPGVACATLVGSSLISRCGTRHTCWLIHHLRGVVLPPLFPCTYFTGCVTSTLRFAREHPTTLVPFTAKWFSTLLCTYISVRSC